MSESYSNPKPKIVCITGKPYQAYIVAVVATILNALVFLVVRGLGA